MLLGFAAACPLRDIYVYINLCIVCGYKKKLCSFCAVSTENAILQQHDQSRHYYRNHDFNVCFTNFEEIGFSLPLFLFSRVVPL